MRAATLSVVALALLSALGTDARAQTARTTTRTIAPTAPRFKVQPLKLRLEGRPGQSLPFEITLSATDSATAILVEAVDLQQDERGTIGPREGPPAKTLRVRLDASQFLLRAGGTALVRGRVNIEGAAAKLRSFGLLVSESSPAQGTSAPSSETKIAVRFALRYLVRVDVVVRGGRDARISEQSLEGGCLIDRGGRAVARVFLRNPTHSIFQLQADAQLRRADGSDLGPPFPLVLPIKTSRVGTIRTTARILPGARVRLESRVPEPVQPGAYRMVIRLRAGRNDLQRVEFPLSVGPDEFPAQATVLPRVVASVLISPPRVELSTGRGGTRMVPLVLENTGDAAVDLDLVSLPEAAGEPSRVMVRPQRLTLAPRATRRVAVVVTGRGTGGANHYEHLRVRVLPHGGMAGGSQQLEVAIIGRAGDVPEIELGEPVAEEASAGPLTFAVPVENTGRAHLALSGRLRVRDAYGRVLEEVSAGFGAWLLPGDETRLLFGLTRPLLPGTYALDVSLDSPGTPLEIQRTFQVSGPKERIRFASPESLPKKTR